MPLARDDVTPPARDDATAEARTLFLDPPEAPRRPARAATRQDPRSARRMEPEMETAVRGPLETMIDRMPTDGEPAGRRPGRRSDASAEPSSPGASSANRSHGPTSSRGGDSATSRGGESTTSRGGDSTTSRGGTLRSEGPEVEWKVSLPARDRIANTLAAFANGCGGSLLVGVRDDGRVKGISNPPAVRGELERVNRERLSPSVPIRFRILELHGRRVLEARVERARERPVRVFGPDGDVRVYVRELDSSRPANEDEIRLLRNKPERVRYDPRMRRLLACVHELPRPTASDVAKASRLGLRTARPLLQNLRRAGLIGQKDGRRLWVTPSGYRVLSGV